MEKKNVGARSDPGRTPIANSGNEKEIRTLDHSGHLLDTGYFHVVFVDGSKEEVKEGELVLIDEIEDVEFDVAAVERVADLVKISDELRLVVLIDPDVSSVVPWHPERGGREEPQGLE